MKLPSPWFLVVAAIFVIALLLANGALNLANIQQLDTESYWVDHSGQVVIALGNLRESAVEGETNARGFLLTGNPVFLQPFDSSSAQIGHHVDELQSLIADNPDQLSRLPVLRARLTQRFKTLGEAVDEKKKRVFEPSGVTASGNRGKNEMDAIRSVIAEMIDAEHTLMAQRSAAAHQTYHFAILSAIISVLASVIVLLGFLFLLIRFIRARQAAAATIFEHAEHLRTTLASIGDAVITTDIQGKVTNMNNVAQAMTAWNSIEAEGEPLSTIFNIVNEMTREVVESPVDRSLREGTIVGLANHTILIAKDGKEIPIEDSAAPIRYADGEIVGCVLVFRDVSERKAAERADLDNRVRLRQLADAMPQIVWAALPDGTLDYYNAKWFEYIALDPEKIDEARWDLYIHPDDLPRAYKRWAESVDTGKDYEVEFRVRNAAGDYCWFLVRALPVTENGQIVRWYGTCTDIDREIKTGHELREAAARLSEADRRKNEFLAMLAHELRNPLAPIRNSLEIVRLKATDDDLANAGSMMDRQVSQLVRLVDDLLDVSRINSGKIELRKRSIDLNAVVSAAIEGVRSQYERQKISLSSSLPRSPIYMEGDPARLTQTMGNLLNNARKFTDPGGTVTVDVAVNNGIATIRVRDTGIGIDSRQLAKIFDLFVQADTSLERSTSGLGIGLSLVKTLVEMHSGTVEAKSEGLGHGSEFQVRLPVSSSESVSGSEPVPASADRPAVVLQKILVVDDNADSAESLSLLLEMAGHEVRLARDGVEAIDAAAAFRPNTILLDIGLPRMNGYEAAREIRRHEWGSRITLVASTGWGQVEDRERSKEAGFDFHLVKPIDHDELLKILQDRAG